MKKPILINFLLIALLILILISGYYFLIYEKKEFQSETLVIYNWEDYLPLEIIQDFETKYNVKIEVIEYIDENEVINNLMNKEMNYDILIASDYLIEDLIKKNLLFKLNLKKIPNYKYIDPLFLNLKFDKKNKYSLPYMWGTTGILYNKKYFNPYEISVNYLWDEKYSQKIGLIKDFQEIYFLTSRYLKLQLPLEDEKYFELIKDEIINQKKLISGYENYNILEDKMIKEELFISLIYSDSAFFAIQQNPNLVYKIPKEGGTIWIDNLVILKNSNNKELAQKFINYIHEPEINKKLTEELLAFNPNLGSTKNLSQEYYQKVFEKKDFEKLYFLNEIKDEENINILKENFWNEIKDN